MIVFRLAAAAAGLSALLVAGLGSGTDPGRPSPAAHIVAALNARLHQAAPRVAARGVAAPAVATARAIALASPELDLVPVGALAPTATPSASAQPAASAPNAAPAPPVAPSPSAPPPQAAAPRLDGTALAAAAVLYRKGDLAGGDALAAKADDAAARAAFDWLALRLAPRPDDRRLAAFAAAHPHWPGEDWIRAVEEAHLYADHPPAAVVAAQFAADPPQTTAGKLALARAALETGRRDEAAAIVEARWREDDLDAWTEAAALKDFASLLSRADHKYRADRLLYAEKSAAALRAAALAGP